MLLCFFFSCSVAHRDLHSFPTRRSSDLAHPTVHAQSADAQGDENEHPDSPDAQPGDSRTSRDARFHRPDRKSTRLNSSHTVISYAVFCLKKKKKKKRQKKNAQQKE